MRGELVVAGNHNNAYPRFLTKPNRLFHSIARRVAHNQKAGEFEIAQSHKRVFINLFITDGDNPQAIGKIFFQNFFHSIFFHRADIAVF